MGFKTASKALGHFHFPQLEPGRSERCILVVATNMIHFISPIFNTFKLTNVYLIYFPFRKLYNAFKLFNFSHHTLLISILGVCVCVCVCVCEMWCLFIDSFCWFFAYKYSAVPAHLLRRLSFLHWVTFVPFSKISQLHFWAYFWTLYSVSLMYMSTLSLIYHTVPLYSVS